MEGQITYTNGCYDSELAQQASLNLEFYKAANAEDENSQNPIDVTDTEPQMEGGETKYFSLTKSNAGTKDNTYKPNIFNKNTYNRLKKAREASKCLKC